MFKNIPFNRVYWTTSIFLILTLLLSVTAVPIYLWCYGLSLPVLILSIFYLISTGLSITLGYHRLFSHKTFKAHPLVTWYTLFFGAAAFENSAINWASDHRRHHKHVDDHDEDPYSISRGFWWAHIGWLMFKLHPEAPLDNVKDLQRIKSVRLQHKYIIGLSLFSGLLLPTLLGWALTGTGTGALGGFLIAGVLRIVLVQHATFFINSACHYIGRQPYSTSHSARDSWFMALFTFGEGYHNYHHEFEYDYRNGVKPWQFDPTKWTIWLLSKVGLAKNLKTVPDAKIIAAEMNQVNLKAEKICATIIKYPEMDLIKYLPKYQTMIEESKEGIKHIHNLSKRELRKLHRQIRLVDRQMEDFISSIQYRIKLA